MKSRSTHPLFLAIPSNAAAGGTKAVDDAKWPARVPPKWSREVLFEKLEGHWEGTCRTWSEPGRLADESRVVGRIHRLLADPFLRHVYTGSMQGKPRHGEETIAYNAIAQAVQVAWLDDYGMSNALLFATGRLTEFGFGVRGEYDVVERQPRRGWRTDYQLLDEDHLTITGYNIGPTGGEAKAVETVYVRVRPPEPTATPAQVPAA